jgi:hypothetical protein
MEQTVRFEHDHEIVIAASPGEVLDYVSNPRSWPEWMPATHHIDSPDRPLRQGETFTEKWHTRRGEVLLEWRIAERVDGSRWVAVTETPFTGPIEAHYLVEDVDGGTRYTRRIVNPARPKAPADEAVARMDEEADICLRNIKEAVEARAGRAGPA